MWILLITALPVIGKICQDKMDSAMADDTEKYIMHAVCGESQETKRT